MCRLNVKVRPYSVEPSKSGSKRVGTIGWSVLYDGRLRCGEEFKKLGRGAVGAESVAKCIHRRTHLLNGRGIHDCRGRRVGNCDGLYISPQGIRAEDISHNRPEDLCCHLTEVYRRVRHSGTGTGISSIPRHVVLWTRSIQSEVDPSSRVARRAAVSTRLVRFSEHTQTPELASSQDPHIWLINPSSTSKLRE